MPPLVHYRNLGKSCLLYKQVHFRYRPMPGCLLSLLVQPGEKKNPFCVRPSWHIMTPYAQSTLPEE
jgi:hypothetical protein